MGFSRQEYWSGVPFPSPGHLPNPGIEPASPALAGEFFTTEAPGKPSLGPLKHKYQDEIPSARESWRKHVHRRRGREVQEEMLVNPGGGEKEGQRKAFLRPELPAEEPRTSQEQACLSICPRQAQPGAGRSPWDVWPHAHAPGPRAWHWGIRQSCSPTIGDWRAAHGHQALPFSPSPTVSLGPIRGRSLGSGESQPGQLSSGWGCRMGTQASLLA